MKVICVSFFSVLFFIDIQAQTKSIIVVDDDRMPIEYANVCIISKSDSSFVMGGVTNERGMYSYNYSNDMKQMLAKVSYVGCVTAFEQLPIDTIYLKSDKNTLKEVVVKRSRNFVSPKPKGIEVKMEGNPISNLPSISDAIKQMPLIDGTGGSISVIGKGSPEIYIDHRKVRDLEELNSLSPNDVSSVEIITRPGARYSSDVTSVIIIHRKKTFTNFAGNIKGVGAVSEVRSGNVTSDFSYSTKSGLNIFAGGTYSNDGFEQTRTYKEQFNDDKFQTITDGVYESRAESYKLKTGLSYDINKTNSVGIRYEYGKEPYTHFKSTANAITNALENSEISTFDNNNSNSNSHYVNAFSVFSFGKDKKMEWVTDMDYYHGGDNSSQSVEEKTFGGLRNITTQSENKYDLVAGKTNLDINLKGIAISVGIQYSHTHNEMLFNGNSLDGNSIFQSSTDSESQNLYAGYAEASKSFDENWSVNCGLRYEITDFEYNQNGIKVEEQSKIFHDLLPNFGVTYTKDKLTLNLSYSSNISRPSYSMLNNNYFYVNPTSWETGNPLLKSSINKSMELTMYWNHTILSASYERMKRDICTTYDHNAERNVVIRKEINLPDYNRYSVSFTQSMNIGIWHPMIQGVVMFHNLQYGTDNRKYNKAFGQIYMSNRFDIPFGIYAYLGGSWFNGQSCATYWNSTYTLYAMLNKSFKHWVFNVSYNDFLGRYKQESNVITNGVNHYEYRKGGSQEFQVSVTYKFNSSKKFKGKGAAGDELERLNR